MLRCDNCGAALSGDTGTAIRCGFCGAIRSPAPKAIPVPVPVQVVHQVVTDQAENALRCPHCRRLLVTLKVGDDVSLAGCGRCGGIWLDNASARTLITSPQRIVVDLARRAGEAAARDRSKISKPDCPICSAIMDRSEYHGIELDVCPTHGTWFDAFELSHVLERTLRRDPTQPKPASGTVRCALCRCEVKRSYANITPQGLSCDACWRDEQSRVLQDADRQHQQATGSVLAVLALGAAIGAAALSKR